VMFYSFGACGADKMKKITLWDFLRVNMTFLTKSKEM
jgi:hypothetical protein